MNFHKLSLILLISAASSFAMEDLSLSTMKRTVAELDKQIKQKEKQNKRTFAWARGKIASKFNARDQDKSLAMYQNSIDTIEQEGLKKSKEYFTKTVLTHIATGDKERLQYAKKFVEKELVALQANMTTLKEKQNKLIKDLSALSASSNWNPFAYFISSTEQAK